MSITFTALASSDTYSDGVCRRRLTSTGFAQAGVYGTHRRGLRSVGVAFGGSIETDPEIPAIGAHSRNLGTTGSTKSERYTTDGTSLRRLSSFGYSAPAGYAGGTHSRALRTWGRYEDAAAGHALLIAPPFNVVSFGDQWFQVVQDTLSLSGRPARIPTAVLREILCLQFNRSARYEGTQRVADVVAFSGRLSWVVVLLLQEGIALNDTATGSFTQIIRVLARLIASGHATGVADALVQIVDGIVLLTMQEALNKADASDTVVLGAMVDSLYSAIARAVSRVVLQANVTGEQQIVVVLRDNVVLQADLSNEVDLVMLLRDSIGFAATLSFDNGEYIAWVLNTESKGLSRYTNYPFNSLTRFRNRYYGAASDGIHRLEGDRDNGDDINAFIRGGLSDYGTRLRKRMPECFIGYTSTGTLVLRVIIVDEEGNKASAHYTLPRRGAANKQANRFKLGRGLESVDWAFEIHNADGADFDISSVEFRPVMLTRRTRG